MFRDRKILLKSVYIFVIFCLGARLFYLQVIDGNGLSRSAALQRFLNEEIEIPRGSIVDRNGIPFTGREEKSLLVLKPLMLKSVSKPIDDLSDILGINRENLRKRIDFSDQPILLTIDNEEKSRIKELPLPGISYINTLERYGDKTLARHVLGYINSIDETGEAGIEKYYNDVLKSDNETSVGIIADAKKKPLQGFGYRLLDGEGKGKGLGVKLTLDYHIQKIVEKVMNETGIKGAVVVEDVNNGDLVAMASKPDFLQNNIGQYLSSSNNELFNKAVAAYDMGSTFKIIDVAAALENNFEPDKGFYCRGSISIGSREFKCSSYYKGGHGITDLDRAFAESCNPYFIELGINTGYENIIEMARKFGLGSITGIKGQGIDESSGSIPNEKYYSQGDIANLSIGQGTVMVTPLQVADIVAIVANGGIKNKINIVDSIVTKKGSTFRKVREDAGERIISKETAERIKELMVEVVSSGTGTKADIKQYGGAAGKTGSAETGQTVNGIKVVHAWFGGYFPIINPKYSIAVFVENGKSGGEAAAPIFKAIAEEIMKKGY